MLPWQATLVRLSLYENHRGRRSTTHPHGLTQATQELPCSIVQAALEDAAGEFEKLDTQRREVTIDQLNARAGRVRLGVNRGTTLTRGKDANE